MREYEDDRDLEGFFEMEQESDMMGLANLDLMNTGLHHQIMQTAIHIVEKEWFWRFRAPEYKLRKITTAFRHLNKLISEAKDD
jgi:hypothetical protein